MARISLSRAWDEAKRIFAHDGGLLAAVALALLVLPDIVVGVMSPSTEIAPSLPGRFIGLVAVFVSIIGQLAIVRLALGPSTTVGQAIGHGARRFPAAFSALLLLGLGVFLIAVPVVAVLIAAGMVDVSSGRATPDATVPVLVLVTAFLLLAVRFMLTVPIASAEPAGPLAILKRSWRLSKGSYWALFALELLLLLVAVVLMVTAQLAGGVIASFVGGNLTPYGLAALILAIIVALAQAAFTVLASVMLARIYVQLAGKDAEVSVPSSGT
ncbi:MAG: glycerophosphoryl diester phosphodiesterase membrane domain-containing protein [Sphingomicrobium sp.]